MHAADPRDVRAKIGRLESLERCMIEFENPSGIFDTALDAAPTIAAAASRESCKKPLSIPRLAC